MGLDYRLQRLVDRLEADEPDAATVGAGCHALLAQAIPHDVGVWFSLDPVTLLPTRFEPRFPDGLLSRMNRGLTDLVGVRDTFEQRMNRRIMEVELSVEDSLSPAILARTPGKVATLHGVTGGDPSRNPRAAAMPGPNVLSDERRLMLSHAGECWGMMWLGRRSGSFSKEEQATASALGAALGWVVRASFLRAALAGGGLPHPPGLVFLDEDGAITEVTQAARDLLGDELAGGWRATVQTLAREGRGASLVLDAPGGPVTLHATRMGGRHSVIVERVRAGQLADRLVRAYGLTAREREVVAGLAQGWSTRQIAFQLDLADYTVQDHLRAVFDKIGVRSRKEVLAKLFFDRYLPEQAAGAVPGPYGWFLERGGDG
jgi:DNA-binding CsgD family transcriptional regulator